MERFAGVRPGSRDERQVYTLAVGASLDRTFDDLQQGIYIDNLTNQWLYVSGVERYVTPMTPGWSAAIMPASRVVRVRPVDPPTGVPVLGPTDGQVTIAVTTALAADSPGQAYQFPSAGTQAYQATFGGPAHLHTYEFDVTTNAVANTTTVEDVFWLNPPNGAVLAKFISMKLIFLPNPTLDIMWCRVFHSTVAADGKTLYMAQLGVSPSQPAMQVNFPEPGIFVRSATSSALRIEHRSMLANRRFDLVLGYNLITAP